MNESTRNSPIKRAIRRVAPVLAAVLAGATFWPAICELEHGFGASGAFHDAMLVTSIVAGGVGAFVGLVVAWSFGIPRRIGPR